MTRMEIWLLCFIPLQILFNGYMWICIGTAKNFVKCVVVKAVKEAESDAGEKVSGDSNDR